MALMLHQECKTRLIESVAESIAKFEISHGKFIERSRARTLLQTAEAIVPRKLQERLEAYIDEKPLTEFIIDSLAHELSQTRYNPDQDLINLTDIEGYEDPHAVAARLVARFDQLPRNYRLTIRLPRELSPLLADDQSMVDLSPTIRLLRPNAAYALAYPITKQEGFGLLAGLGSPKNWDTDAVHLQVDVSGFIGIYGGSAPHLEAERMLRSFFGLGIAFGLFNKKYDFVASNNSYSFQVHEQQDDGSWLDVAALNLPDTLIHIIQDICLTPIAHSVVRYAFYLIRIVLTSGKKGEAISLASQWYFDASGGTDELLRYVQSMVVLEIILGDKRSSERIGLNELLRNRCAYLIGESQEERESILNSFNEIYDVRSHIVHRGKHRLRTEERKLLATLQWMCRRAILKEAELLRKNPETAAAND